MSNGPAPVPHPIPPPAPDPDPGVPDDPAPGGPPAPWAKRRQEPASTFVESVAGEEDPGAGADLARDQARMIDKPL